MIVVQNRIPVAEGYEEDFLDRFRTRRGLVDGQPGFIRNVVLRPIKGEHFIVLTFWENEEQFRAWTESEAFKKAHSQARAPSGTYLGHPVFEGFESIL